MKTQTEQRSEFRSNEKSDTLNKHDCVIHFVRSCVGGKTFLKASHSAQLCEHAESIDLFAMLGKYRRRTSMQVGESFCNYLLSLLRNGSNKQKTYRFDYVTN